MIPTRPSEDPIASSCASVRLRVLAAMACTPEWLATSGPRSARATSQNPFSLRWLRSTRIPSSAQRRTRRLALGGEPGARVGARGEDERHAMTEDVGAAPHRPQRTQPGGIPMVERLELGVDRLGALDVQDRGGRPFGVGTDGVEIGTRRARSGPRRPAPARRAGPRQRRRARGVGCAIGCAARVLTHTVVALDRVPLEIRATSLNTAKMAPRRPPSRMRGQVQVASSRPAAIPAWSSRVSASLWPSNTAVIDTTLAVTSGSGSYTRVARWYACNRPG